MTTNGNDVAKKISRARDELREELRQNEASSSSLRSRISAARQKLSDAYEIVAQVRRADPRHAKALAKTDRWLADKAEERKAQHKQIKHNLDAATVRATEIARAHAVAIEALDNATAAWAQARQSVREELADDDAFQQALARQADAISRSDMVDEHLIQIEQAASKMEQACMSDPLFQYCFDRQVGFTEASGWWLTKMLDRMLARSIGFYGNRQRLLDVRADLEGWSSHQLATHHELDAANEQVERLIDQKLESPEGKAISNAKQDAIAEEARLSAELDRARSKVAMFKNDLANHEGMRDRIAVEMAKVLIDAVERADGQTLLRAAAETKAKDDDQAVRSIISLRQEIPGLEEELEKVEHAQKETASRLRRVEDFHDKFRRNNYQGSYSRFDHGFDINALIAGIIVGRMSVGDAMGQCRRYHRDVTPPPPPSPRPYSSSSSMGGFGSSGGGGFRTGGSFGGGGGGFRTGGRF